MTYNLSEHQRDLYKLLLEMHTFPDTEFDVLIRKALDLIIKITGANLGYIELRDAHNTLWWSEFHCSEENIKEIRKKISSGIIAQALNSNETIITPKAYMDDRFKDRDSVQKALIEAVLCAPLNINGIKGVIYLEGNTSFESDVERNLLETSFFTKYIIPPLKILHRQIIHKTQKCAFRSRYNLESIIGDNSRFIQVLEEAMTIAELDLIVLLTGETGTGKTHLAKSIHSNSPRRNGPFIHVSCPNLPTNLIESELFGTVRGAFTNAINIKGKISMADQGTLFLDEIGELPLEIQSKLLHFFEEGFFYALGSQKKEMPDVRIITASNIDFEDAISRNKFRSDLYYRIAVYPIELPPLRERTSDIDSLITFFTHKFCRIYKIPTIPIRPNTFTILSNYEWPGNTRQLEHAVQQAVVRARKESSNELNIHHFFLSEKEQKNLPLTTTAIISYRESKDDWERQFISRQLHENNGNVTKTARAVGLSRAHMNNLIKYHNLTNENFRT